MTSRRVLAPAALVLLLAAFFGLFATRIWDIDFWWHLATGRVIVETGAIPQGDPFGVYDAATPAGSTILKGYWLLQSLFYLVYQALGTGGIIALKAGILTGGLLVLHRRATMAGAHAAVAWLVTILTGLTLTSFTGERPQLASFVLSSVLFLLLDRFRHDPHTRWIYAVPAVVLLWANCHGGVLLGAILLVTWSLGYAVERRGEWAGTSPDRAVLLGVLGLSVLMAFASPVGWNTLLTVIQQEGSSEIRSRISEYASPWALWREIGLLQFYPYAALVGLAAVSLGPLLRARRFADAALVLLLGALSARAFRYVPFLPLVAGPYVALGVTRLADRALRRAPPMEGVVAAAAVVALILGVRSGAMFQSGIKEELYPTKSVERLRDLGAGGRVLTSFEWGGFVLWNLRGKLRPYLDSRNLDPDSFARYTHMIWATPQGLEYLARERFDYVLLPRLSFFRRERYALGPALLADPRWRLVYEDPTALIFAAR